jgi:hypothetical protein
MLSGVSFVGLFAADISPLLSSMAAFWNLEFQ